MKKHNRLSCLFMVLAVLLSHILCATAAYTYCGMQWGIRYEGYSAPASIAFLPAIPYGAGIVICIVLAWVFHRKHRSGK